jgi:hypothetical protein
MGIYEECFAASDENARSYDLKSAAFRAFHFVPQEFYARVIGVRYLIIKSGSFIVSYIRHTFILAKKKPHGGAALFCLVT